MRKVPLLFVALALGCGESKPEATNPHDHGGAPSAPEPGPAGGGGTSPAHRGGGDTPSVGAGGGSGGAGAGGGAAPTTPVEPGRGADAGAPAGGSSDPGGTPMPAPTGGGSADLLGKGDHGPTSVKLVALPTAARCLAQPWDLAFNPRTPGQLWVVNHGDDSVCIVHEATGAAAKSENRLSPGHEHFMPRPSGIAFGGDKTSFGVPGTFATANDTAGDGRPDDGGLWNGITLWPSDLKTFAVFKGPDGNSHLDMLHDSPLARGIAWERDNIYWVFGSHLGDITRYDFAMDHDRGNSNHRDGKQWHYLAGQVKGVNGVPSHLAYHEPTKSLFIADTGNKRVLKLDTASGTMSPTRHTRPNDRVETVLDAVMENAKVVDLVPAGGDLKAPAGLDLAGEVVVVGDHATGVIHAYDQTGKRLNWLDTGAGPNAITGLAVGPDRRLYFLNAKTNQVFRIEP